MRSNDRKFIIKTAISLSISLFISMSFTFILCLWIDSWIWIFALSLLFASIVGYVTVTYCLSTLLKTNRFLDILLKDTLHELNIPLSVIKANLQMIRENENDPKKQKRLERIALASDDLYVLYKEVDYYIKKEIQEVVKEHFILEDLLNRIIEKQKEMAQDVVIQTQNVHVQLYADKHGLGKVVSNLLHNAVKYNRNNRPISIVFDAGILTIRDQGIGMSEAELFLAFDRYYQADTSKEGYGIGLSLVKAYCDECKIPLRIFSKKEEGTSVVLDISRLVDTE